MANEEAMVSGEPMADEQPTANGEPMANGERLADGDKASEAALDREAERITVAVMAASRLIVALSARALASVDAPLTLPQLRSLVALHTCGPIKLAAMAATLGVTSSTALRMAERLEAQGLTDRRVNPDNRREVVLRLTPAGEELVERVLSHRRAEIRALVERLPAPERAGLVPALTALTTAAGQLDPALAATTEADRLTGMIDDPLNPTP
ncbi:MarR family winged helix-turn-helix transcriptional regulator [Streptomyces sp. NPDC048192]|jgi:DNA-binding MarR family transcriptional regulator|uniref:MarR family winged helix-turn-helix transcriptional regulator n=1 Tax=Streptomyces sp. NPDC048192 TaxID=3365510 RepID=UPI0037168F17